MSDDRQPFTEPRLVTRRDFTLEAALAVLAGCVITVSDACGGSSNPSTPTPTDITGVVSANHGHTAVITGAAITAGNAVSITIQGTAVHNHTVTFTPA